MYEKFFKFAESPFNLTPDPRFFFFSKEHEEAFDHVRYGIQERKGFIVVTGEVGMGKTTLSRLLLEKLDKKVRTSMIFNPSLNTIELLQAVNHDFGISWESTSKKELVAGLNRFLLDTLAEEGNALLLIDEGQNLSIECLEEIRMLSNLETEKQKLLQILLLGQPELREKLQLPALRQLNQRIAIRYHLAPLELEETKTYVAHRLKVAGGQARPLFSPTALKRLYRYSGGVPRLINILSDKALLAAYVRESPVVEDADINRAASELVGPPIATARRRTLLYWTGRRRDLMGGGHSSEARWFTPIGSAVIGLLLVLLGLLVWAVPAWFNSRRSVENVTLPESSIASNSVPSGVSEEVRPPSASVVEPVESVAARAAENQAGRFDPDGVFRVTDPEETHKAALLTLLKIWGVSQNPSVEEFKGMDVERLMSASGFSTHLFPVNLKQVRLFDYPCLVRGHWTDSTVMTDSVLVNLTEHDATLLDPLKGKVTLSLEVLETMWGEQGEIYWKQLPGITLPLKTKTVDPSVKAIQNALKAQGLYIGKVDGVLGLNTKRAIRYFKQKYGLKDDSTFDLESYLVLSRVMLQEIPGLQVRNL
ncbi:MAG TPA: AAA family ATPase [Nitrospiria bacterium]|nr:AAA family ATPase [Nitrospiria bacterium]